MPALRALSLLSRGCIEEACTIVIGIRRTASLLTWDAAVYTRILDRLLVLRLLPCQPSWSTFREWRADVEPDLVHFEQSLSLSLPCLNLCSYLLCFPPKAFSDDSFLARAVHAMEQLAEFNGDSALSEPAAAGAAMDLLSPTRISTTSSVQQSPLPEQRHPPQPHLNSQLAGLPLIRDALLLAIRESAKSSTVESLQLKDAFLYRQLLNASSLSVLSLDPHLQASTLLFQMFAQCSQEHMTVVMSRDPCLERPLAFELATSVQLHLLSTAAPAPSACAAALNVLRSIRRHGSLAQLDRSCDKLSTILPRWQQLYHRARLCVDRLLSLSFSAQLGEQGQLLISEARVSLREFFTNVVPPPPQQQQEQQTELAGAKLMRRCGHWMNLLPPTVASSLFDGLSAPTAHVTPPLFDSSPAYWLSAAAATDAKSLVLLARYCHERASSIMPLLTYGSTVASLSDSEMRLFEDLQASLPEVLSDAEMLDVMWRLLRASSFSSSSSDTLASQERWKRLVEREFSRLASSPSFSPTQVMLLTDTVAVDRVAHYLCAFEAKVVDSRTWMGLFVQNMRVLLRSDTTDAVRSHALWFVSMFCAIRLSSFRFSFCQQFSLLHRLWVLINSEADLFTAAVEDLLLPSLPLSCLQPLLPQLVSSFNHTSGTVRNLALSLLLRIVEEGNDVMVQQVAFLCVSETLAVESTRRDGDRRSGAFAGVFLSRFCC